MSADAILALAVAVLGVLALVLEHAGPRRKAAAETLDDHEKRLTALESWRSL